MENIRITTAQNVGIDYELASLGDRMAAFLLDYIVIKGGYLFAWFMVYREFEHLEFEHRDWFIIVSLVLPLLLYDVLMEILHDGQSLGKSYFKLKVVMLDGTRPSVVAFLLRWVFRMIELDTSMGSLALWFYLFSGKGQRLGDMAAGTTVVKLRKESLSSTIFEDLISDYEPMFAEVQHMNDTEADIIRELLASIQNTQASRLHYDAIAAETARRLAYRLQLKTDLESYALLDRLLKDYNHFHSVHV